MRPSDVRAAALAEHAQLLASLDDLARRAGMVLAGQAELVPALWQGLAELAGRLERHASTDSRLLVPTLRRIDAWGEARVERLALARAVQAGALDALTTRARGHARTGRPLAREILRFSNWLRAEIAREEAEMLNPDLLRDDLVSVAQTDG